MGQDRAIKCDYRGCNNFNNLREFSVAMEVGSDIRYIQFKLCPRCVVFALQQVLNLMNWDENIKQKIEKILNKKVKLI